MCFKSENNTRKKMFIYFHCILLVNYRPNQLMIKESKFRLFKYFKTFATSIFTVELVEYTNGICKFFNKQ